jgi:hypothetical protein
MDRHGGGCSKVVVSDVIGVKFGFYGSKKLWTPLLVVPENGTRPPQISLRAKHRGAPVGKD